MAKPNEIALAALDAADWDDIAPKLLTFIIYYMRVKNIATLPDSMTPDDLAIDVVRRIYLGARTGGKEGRFWNPAKHTSLLCHLKWIARSDLSSKGLLAKKGGTELVFKDSEQELDDLCVPLEDPIVDDAMEDAFAKALKQEIAGDTKLENIVAAIELGCLKSGDIAREADIELNEMYELKRKLIRKAEKARDRIRQSTEGGR